MSAFVALLAVCCISDGRDKKWKGSAFGTVSYSVAVVSAVIMTNLTSAGGWQEETKENGSYMFCSIHGLFMIM